MSFSSFFRQRLNQIIALRDEPNILRKYRPQRKQFNKASLFRHYPLGRSQRLSDTAGRTYLEGTTPRRYRPNSSEVYYDVNWFRQ